MRKRCGRARREARAGPELLTVLVPQRACHPIHLHAKLAFALTHSELSSVGNEVLGHPQPLPFQLLQTRISQTFSLLPFLFLAFQYPQLNLSQLLKSSWVRTGRSCCKHKESARACGEGCQLPPFLNSGQNVPSIFGRE